MDSMGCFPLHMSSTVSRAGAHGEQTQKVNQPVLVAEMVFQLLTWDNETPDTQPLDSRTYSSSLQVLDLGHILSILRLSDLGRVIPLISQASDNPLWDFFWPPQLLKPIPLIFHFSHSLLFLIQKVHIIYSLAFMVQTKILQKDSPVWDHRTSPSSSCRPVQSSPIFRLPGSSHRQPSTCNPHLPPSTSLDSCCSTQIGLSRLLH